MSAMAPTASLTAHVTYRGCEDANEGGQKGAAGHVRYDASDDDGAALGVAQPEYIFSLIQLYFHYY
jgi:hypothetical protein